MVKTAIIAIHYGSPLVTKKLLLSLKPKIKDNLLVLLNNTADPISALSEIIPGTVTIENQGNAGFAKAINKGINRALSDPSVKYIFLMNNDLVIEEGTLEQLALTFRHKPDAGIVAPVLRHGANQYDWGAHISKYSGLVIHRNFPARPKTVLSAGHVSGAAMMIKREAVEKIGLFDERFFMYYEDADYCLRARNAGYTIRINPIFSAFHQISSSSSRVLKTLYLWHSHILFVSKYLFKYIYPSAYILDIIYYPLLIVKALFRI